MKSSYWFACVSCFAIMLLLPMEKSGAQEETPKSAQGGQSTPAERLSRQQQLQKFLLGELDQLIPVKLDDNPEMKTDAGKAVAAFIAGKVDDASRVLSEMKTKYPDVPPVDLLKAGLLYGAGNAEAGFGVLEKAAVGHPEYPGIYIAFARLAVGQKRLTDAIALLNMAKSKVSGRSFSELADRQFKTQIYDTQIDVAMLRKDYAMAKTAMTNLGAILPENPKVILTAAELDFMNDDFRGAFSKLKRFHAANPKSQLPEMVMASWYQRAGNLEETKNWITKAAEAYPRNANVQIEFANYMVTLGEFPAAKIAAKKVEEMQGGEVPATVLLKAKIAFASEAYSIAEIHYEKLAKAQPTSFDLTNMYALSLIESDSEEKQQKALSITQQNLQRLPDNYVAQAAFGWALHKLGKSAEAKAMFGRAARAPQLAPEVAYFLANYLHSTGNSAQAKLVLEPAVKTTGLFLYRIPAGKLLSELSSSSSGALPSPGG